MANHSIGSANNGWKGGPQEGICQICRSIFTAPRWEMKHRKFCSRKCSDIAKIDPSSRRTRPHVLIAERVLGKRLPSQAVVHHFNENRKDNSRSNLVVCQDQAYHLLLHARKRICDAGGNPNADKICSRCKTPKPLDDFHLAPNNGDGRRCYCKPCQSDIYHERRAI
jgi:hypothetical protein